MQKHLPRSRVSLASKRKKKNARSTSLPRSRVKVPSTFYAGKNAPVIRCDDSPDLMAKQFRSFRGGGGQQQTYDNGNGYLHNKDDESNDFSDGDVHELKEFTQGTIPSFTFLTSVSPEQLSLF